MPRKIISLFFLFYLSQSRAQTEAFPVGEELSKSKLHRSFLFSSKKLDSKLASKELQIIDTLLKGNCFIVKSKHKNGNYALLCKRGHRFELQYLKFSTLSAVPYFVNDSLDMNRDKKNEIIIYWSATVNTYPAFTTYEGTKTGLQIIDISKRKAIAICDLNSCGAGLREGYKVSEGICHYQFGLSFMPMAIVVTAYKVDQLSINSANPQIRQYNLKKNKFQLQSSQQ